jgi:hypothetical protein
VTETQAKRLLTRMLSSFTSGSVLHLLADLHRDAAERARRTDDVTLYRRNRLAEQALIVVGTGLDAECPPGR